jgi:hypothetical protein
MKDKIRQSDERNKESDKGGEVIKVEARVEPASGGCWLRCLEYPTAREILDRHDGGAVVARGRSSKDDRATNACECANALTRIFTLAPGVNRTCVKSKTGEGSK